MSVAAPTPVIFSTPSVLFLGSESSIQSFDAQTGKLLGSTVASSSSASAALPIVPDDKRARHGGQNHIVRYLIATEDGKTAVTLGEDKMLRVWEVGGWKLKSERKIIKKASFLAFSAEHKILVADRSGDVFSYPLEPAAQDSVEAKPRPTLGELAADPSLNPDADLLAGHVSVVTSLVMSKNDSRLITADRDEHIRVSRYPKSYVIDTLCLGHESFVSALHIPSTHPDLLISGGGDSSLFIWRWETGSLFFTLPFETAVFPHRCVKAEMRRDKLQRKRKVVEGDAASAPDDFATPPEGYMLPYGHGLCIGSIDSVSVGDETAVIFFSEGCKAIHGFTLGQDLSATSSSPSVTTLAFSAPVLTFKPLTSHPGLLLVSLDLTWGVLNANGERGGVKGLPEIDEEVVMSLQGRGLKLVKVSAGAELTDVSSEYSELLEGLQAGVVLSPVRTLIDYALYPNLGLLPRWAGGEEEDDLAGEATVDADDISKAGRRKLGRMKAKGLLPAKPKDETRPGPGEGKRNKNKKKKVGAEAATEVEAEATTEQPDGNELAPSEEVAMNE